MKSKIVSGFRTKIVERGAKSVWLVTDAAGLHIEKKYQLPSTSELFCFPQDETMLLQIISQHMESTGERNLNVNQVYHSEEDSATYITHEKYFSPDEVKPILVEDVLNALGFFHSIPLQKIYSLRLFYSHNLAMIDFITRTLFDFIKNPGHRKHYHELLYKTIPDFENLVNNKIMPILCEKYTDRLVSELPKALVYGDLNSRNYYRSGGKLTFIDWSDAHIDSRMFDLIGLLTARESHISKKSIDRYLGIYSHSLKRNSQKPITNLERESFPLLLLMHRLNILNFRCTLWHSPSDADTIRVFEQLNMQFQEIFSLL